MKALLLKLSEFFQDDSKMLSSTRLVFIITTLTIVGVWVSSCWYQKKMVPVEQTAIYLIITLMTGKVAQSVADNKS